MFDLEKKMYKWIKKTAIQDDFINPTAFELREIRKEKYISVNSEELWANLDKCKLNYPKNKPIISLLVKDIVWIGEWTIKKEFSIFSTGFKSTHCWIYHNKYWWKIVNYEADYLTYRQILARISVIENNK